jgi:aspartate/tyrosine/aromatic aminotransferase
VAVDYDWLVRPIDFPFRNQSEQVMFENVPVAPPDPILGLNDSFERDPRENKINLSVGVFKDDAGKTPVLAAVKAAEKLLLEKEATKTYLGIDGLAEFNRHVRELLFADTVAVDQVATVQVPGGTAGVRLAADFLAEQLSGSRIWISNPTWVNHHSIFASAGVDVQVYPYLSSDKTKLDFTSMCETLRERTHTRDAVLLHACCHNPSGVDPTDAQWATIADLMAERELLPIIDFAYQGFGQGLQEDARGLRILQRRCGEVLVASSFSKNFGLYSERVGAMTAVLRSAEAATATLSQLKRIVRSNWSNPPRHGAAIVVTILDQPQLRSQWMSELDQMRQRIADMRHRFVALMKEKAPQKDFSFLLTQQGMFSFSGLSPLQVDQLKNEHGIYIVGSGRINVAGITTRNLIPLCDAVAAIL